MTILPKKKTVGGKNEGENETHLGGGGYLASNQVITFKLKFTISRISHLALREKVSGSVP